MTSSTRLLKLWIASDEVLEKYWRAAALEAIDSTQKNAGYVLARRLRRQFENESKTTGAHGFWADLIKVALSEVDWHEIAESMVAEVPNNEGVRL